MMNNTSLMNDLQREASAPPEEARALPFAAYTDPEVYELERKKIFHRDWVALCAAAALPKPGDYFALNLAGEPVVVIRGDDNELRAMSNTCRHRGTQLLDEGYGNISSFLCPYHAWNYDKAGRLKGVPYPGNVKIDKDAHRLGQFSLTVWAGVLFINLDPSAKPLEPRLKGLDRYFRNYQVDRFDSSPKPDGFGIWKANWKLALENGIESYHLFRVHPDTFEASTPTRGAYYLEGSARWAATAGKLNKPWKVQPDHPKTLGVFELENYTLISIPPNLVGTLSPDSWGWLSILPLGPEKCLVSGGSLAPSSAVERYKKYPEKKSASAQFNMAVMEEDRKICERGQRGMQARLSGGGGKLVELERIVANFHNYLAWRMFDQEPPKSWSSPEAAELARSPKSVERSAEC